MEEMGRRVVEARAVPALRVDAQADVVAHGEHPLAHHAPVRDDGRREPLRVDDLDPGARRGP